MTTFSNGPCKGTPLHLRRTPVILRVVQTGEDFKALTGHDDKPKPGDTVHLYLMVQQGGFYKAPPLKGWFEKASYELWEGEYPDEATICSAIAWRQWCMQNNPGK